MAKQKYTIDDIDKARHAVSWMVGMFFSENRDAIIEDRLRTYLAQGIDVDELCAKAKEEEKLWYERQKTKSKWTNFEVTYF